MQFDRAFDVAILPFQSFMELVGEPKQANTLRSVHRSLAPGGRFYCSMHNSAVRRKTVDGVLRGVGAFPDGADTVVVSGFETGGIPIVTCSQFIERYDASGRMTDRLLQPIAFEMIEEPAFRRMVLDAGFAVCAVFGDYQGRVFDATASPVMIWELEKPAGAPIVSGS